MANSMLNDLLFDRYSLANILHVAAILPNENPNPMLKTIESWRKKKELSKRAILVTIYPGC